MQAAPLAQAVPRHYHLQFVSERHGVAGRFSTHCPTDREALPDWLTKLRGAVMTARSGVAWRELRVLQQIPPPPGNAPPPQQIDEIVSCLEVFDTANRQLVVRPILDAANAGKDVEEYSSLERETEISEATYTVLIEQVKAQSMIAGYQPNNSIIYEYAVTPLTASSPNRKIILAIGAILGLVSGVMLALIFGAFRGVYYSYKTLINGAGAQQNIKSHSLIRTRRMSLNELGEKPPKKSYTHLRKLALLIHSGDKNIILFTSLNSRLKGNNVANALASYMQLDDLKIALINLSSKSLQINNKVKTTSGGEFTIINSEFKLVELQPNNELSPIEAIGRQNFHAHIQSIISNFDFIFISADDSDAIDLANAYASRDVIHFTSAKIKRTKSNNLTKLRKIIPIQGLLYE